MAPPRPTTERAHRPPQTTDWGAALEEHRGWLRSVVLARVGEAQAVDEVLQEIALAVVRGGANLADPARFRSWLYQVAIRQTLLYRRKQGRQRKLIHNFAEKVACVQDNSPADPLDWLLADEQATLLRQSLERLHRRDREILFLKYQHNMSYRDLAAQLGISESAVEARLHRARKRLRRLLHHLVEQDAATPF